MFLVCHVFLQDHMIRVSCNFICRSPSWFITLLSSLVAIGIVVVDMFFFFLIEEQDYCLSLNNMA